MLTFSTAEQLRSHYRDVKMRIHAGADRRSMDTERLPASLAANIAVEEPRETHDLATDFPRVFRWRKIVKHVADRHGYCPQEILGKHRPDRLVSARLEAYWLVKEITGMSYPHVGKIFGRDHSTVLYGIKEFEKRLVHGQVSIDPEMARSVFKSRIQRFMKTLPRARERAIKSRCHKALRILSNT